MSTSQFFARIHVPYSFSASESILPVSLPQRSLKNFKYHSRRVIFTPAIDTPVSKFQESILPPKSISLPILRAKGCSKFLTRHRNSETRYRCFIANGIDV